MTNSETQIVIKLKTQIVLNQKLKLWQNSNCDKTHTLKLWQKSITLTATKLENSNCDKTQTQNMPNVKISNCDKTQFPTEVNLKQQQAMWGSQGSLLQSCILN